MKSTLQLVQLYNVACFNEIGQKDQAKLHSQKLCDNWTEIRTEPNLRPSLTVYTKRKESVEYISALLGLHMPAILAREVFHQSAWLSYKCSD